MVAMGDLSDPPADLDDEQRELWRRVYALPWIQSSDFIVVKMLVDHATITRMLVADLEAVRARGTRFDFDTDQEIANWMAGFGELLAACLIDTPLARELGLIPHTIGGDFEQAASQHAARLQKEGGGDQIVLLGRQNVAWLRQEAVKMRRAAKGDPSKAATHEETAMRFERTAADVEKSLKDL
jgi:hypothetical protein